MNQFAEKLFAISFEGISAGAAISVGAGIVLAFAIHWLLFRILCRLVARTDDQADDLLVAAARQPTRWLVMLFALGAGLQPLVLEKPLAEFWAIGSRMTFALIVGWLAFRLMRAFRQIIEIRADISVADNLRARRRHTRVRILYRIAQFIIGFIVISMMLIAIPAVRTIGVTLMASAGLAGLAVGAAAQPALKNLIAGIQMAFSEPIRLDDVVIVEGEWGRIEDIRLTYVIVRIWDDRRLIVPVSYFLEKPFQNWTTRTSDLLGTVFLHVDPSADVARIRAAFVERVQGHKLWDGRVAILQVTEHRPEAMELRGLLSARNASVAFDLRCDVREAMLTFLRCEMPEALPRRRQLQAADAVFADRPGEEMPFA